MTLRELKERINNIPAEHDKLPIIAPTFGAETYVRIEVSYNFFSETVVAHSISIELLLEKDFI